RAAAVDVDLPARPGLAGLLRVDRDHHALRPEVLGALGNQLRRIDRRRIDTRLIRARLEYAPEVFRGLDPAADAEGNEDLLRHAPGIVEHQVPPLVRRRDVEEN